VAERLTMRRMARRDAPIVVVLDRLVLLLMLAVVAAILTWAMVLQYAFGEIPCPLCLLQRVAMLGCCLGLILQLRGDGSERGSGIGLLFALLLLVVSARQVLLDIVPRPGHSYVGQAVLGLHMPVWSVIIAVALLLGFAIRFVLFGAPQTLAAAGAPLGRWVRGLEIYVVLICGINFLSVVLQCGLGECHTFGYRLLQ
jgi:disulfide bond formation protein DsbB